MVLFAIIQGLAVVPRKAETLVLYTLKNEATKVEVD